MLLLKTHKDCFYPVFQKSIPKTHKDCFYPVFQKSIPKTSKDWIYPVFQLQLTGEKEVTIDTHWINRDTMAMVQVPGKGELVHESLITVIVTARVF